MNNGGIWVTKKEISADDLDVGVNIKTKQELNGGRFLYSKYLINKVMPKTLDVTEITHVDHGDERSFRGYRENKDMTISLINYESRHGSGMIEIFIPNKEEGK
tara:strand:+ start:1249 stop:1557 length:309 start_codon:yes stop_codon:yes gene_type:complete